MLFRGPPGADDSEMSLPVSPSRNLFHRLIKDPTDSSHPVREWRCTEMLCSVLIHCEALRHRCLRWMATQAGLELPDGSEETDWVFSTEISVSSGRLDLLVEAAPEEADVGEEDASRLLTWIIEVKVQSSFHRTSTVDPGTAETKTTEDPDDRSGHQLVKYDRWLSRQDASYRAGFVLSVDSLTEDMPTSLDQKWTCITWTELARAVEGILTEDDLSEQERFLARQMCGFIQHHLWNGEIMEEQGLTFDDVALIRGMSLYGEGCRDKVRGLVSAACSSLEKTERGAEAPQCQTNLSLTSPKLWARLPLIDSGAVKIQAGVHYADFAVGVWAKPSCSHYSMVRQVVDSHFNDLTERDSRWRRFEDADSDWASKWRPVEIRMPLQDLLAADDQEDKVIEFVEKALRDLEETGILDELTDNLPG